MLQQPHYCPVMNGPTAISGMKAVCSIKAKNSLRAMSGPNSHERPRQRTGFQHQHRSREQPAMGRYPSQCQNPHQPLHQVGLHYRPQPSAPALTRALARPTAAQTQAPTPVPQASGPARTHRHVIQLLKQHHHLLFMPTISVDRTST